MERRNRWLVARAERAEERGNEIAETLEQVRNAANLLYEENMLLRRQMHDLQQTIRYYRELEQADADEHVQRRNAQYAERLSFEGLSRDSLS